MRMRDEKLTVPQKPSPEKRLGSLPAGAVLFTLGALTFLPGLTQCGQTCFDYDENGDRIEFACVTCVERDSEPCTVDTWRLPPGSTCSLNQQPVLDDGESCDLDGTPGVCAAGACEPVPVLAAGGGSTTWRATTNPPGGTGGQGDGGCFVFTTAGPSMSLDVTITLNASSDGAGNLSLGYEVVLTNPLLPLLQDAGVYPDDALTIVTALTHASPNQASNTAEPTATGQILEPFLVGNSLVFATPADITEETIFVTPTSTETVNVNWSGDFFLRIGLVGDQTLFWLDQSDCDFDVQGTGINFDVVQP